VLSLGRFGFSLKGMLRVSTSSDIGCQKRITKLKYTIFTLKISTYKGDLTLIGMETEPCIKIYHET
jgi:hypothetical protein